MKIKILNEEVDIRFCMAVEIEYEELAGIPFNIDDLSSSKNTAALAMAAIKTAKKDTTITLERLTNEASGYEILNLNKAIIDSMTQWMQVPKVVTDAQPQKDVNDADEEKEKN